MENSINRIIIYKPLKTRFYILAVFSVFNFLCGILWNAWSPILTSVREAYGWSLAVVNLQANIFSIVFCLFIVPFIYLWNKTDIRFMYFLSALCLLFGTFIRLYPGSILVQSILIQVGSVITAFGGIMTSIAPPVISMLWFPSHERARATATSISFNSLGISLSPIIASQMVSDISRNGTNIIENGIKRYIFLHCAISIIVVGLIISYFPSKPPILPCKSSDASLRLHLWPGCKSLIRNSQFWIVFFVTMIIYGFNSALSIVAFSYTEPMGINQAEFGVMSSSTNMFTFLSILFGGWLGDRFSFKTIMYASVPGSFISYLITGLMCLKFIPYNLIALYILNSIQNFITCVPCPIVFEMGCESAFPVSEEVVTAVLSFSTNIGIVLFLSVCMIPNIGTFWIPFLYGTLTLFLVPLMWFYKDERNRMETDEIGSERNFLRANDESDSSDQYLLTV